MWPLLRRVGDSLGIGFRIGIGIGAGVGFRIGQRTRRRGGDDRALDVASWDSVELARRLAVLRQENHVPVRLTVRELVEFGR